MIRGSLDSDCEVVKHDCTGAAMIAEPVIREGSSQSAVMSSKKHAVTLKISSAAAKKLRAEVFTISVDENNRKNATCNKCSKMIKMSNGNTTGLKRHLERDHSEQYAKMYGTAAAKKVAITNSALLKLPSSYSRLLGLQLHSYYNSYFQIYSIA